MIKDGKQMNRRENKRNISIRNSIIIVFIISIMVSVSSIGIMIFTNWMSSVKKTTEIMVRDMNNEISRQIDALLKTPYHINEVNQKMIVNEIVDISDEAEREKFFAGVLQMHGNEIYSFSYGTEFGEYYGARRNEEGIIEIIKNNEETRGHSWYYSIKDDLTADQLVMQTGLFDPRTRDWYKVAKETGRPVYSPIYKHFVINDLTVSASWPIYDENSNLVGVLGTHMLLSGIDNYLREVVNDKGGYAFIIEKDSEELIGNSFGKENFIVLNDGSLKRYKLIDIGDQTMQQGYELYKTSNNSNFLLEGNYYVNVIDYHKDGLNWNIVTLLPRSIFIQDIIRNMYITITIVIIAICLSVIVYYIITDKLFKPLGSLMKAMEFLSIGELSRRATISRNDEIGRISTMFNQMADKMNHLVNNLEVNVQERTSELMKANDALTKTKEDLYLILDSTAEGIFGLDLEGNCTFCNNRCIELLGYKDQDNLIGKKIHWLIHHSNREGIQIPIEECRIRNTILTMEVWHVKDEIFWKSDGSFFDVEYYSYPQFKNGILIGAVITFMDITERKKNEEQIQYLSHHDSLTGLMNRRYFEDALKKIDTENNLPISIIFADLNGLKLINDVFGHISGDMLIKKSAEILKRLCRREDLLARIGGDEFIVLLPHTKAKDAEILVDRVRTELSQEKVNSIKCSMALGFDTKTSIYQDIEKIMGSAESEMYKEKLLSRKSFGTDTMNTIMSSLQKKSEREKTHSENVALLCAKMGKVMGLPETDIKKLREAGLLHDIGKIILEENVIRKEEKDLNENEVHLIKQHPLVGYRILNLFDETLDLADDVYSHHEKWDGTGYPKGLKGSEIPLISRIIALAESYERKLSKVDENDPNRKKNILNEICEGSGKNFDPALTEVFIKMIEHTKIDK